MTLDELKDYFERKVKVTTTDIKTFEGVFWGVEPYYDTSSGDDEMELDAGSIEIGIPISEIKSIEIID